MVENSVDTFNNLYKKKISHPNIPTKYQLQIWCPCSCPWVCSMILVLMLVIDTHASTYVQVLHWWRCTYYIRFQVWPFEDSITQHVMRPCGTMRCNEKENACMRHSHNHFCSHGLTIINTLTLLSMCIHSRLVHSRIYERATLGSILDPRYT